MVENQIELKNKQNFLSETFFIFEREEKAATFKIYILFCFQTIF